jgi:mannose-6-phosphate isomerase class I
MRYKYQLNVEEEIGRPSIRGHPYVSAFNFERLGCRLFVTETRHGKIKNVASDRLYLVLEGHGRFTVGDDTFPVEPGDVVIVPRNTPYDYEAHPHSQLKVFLVHAPANIEEADISLEDQPQPDQAPEAPDTALKNA